jgi:lipopolysaccharide biosynthesis glycosyltransferase
MTKAMIGVLMLIMTHWNSHAMKQQEPIDPINFVLFTDDNYIASTMVTLYSFLKYNKYPKHIIILLKSKDPIINISILSQLVSVNSKNSILTFVNASHKNISSRIRGITLRRNADPLKIKMILPAILGSDHLPIMINDYIWLDTDILVMNDINKLYFDCSLSKAPIVAANFHFLRGSSDARIKDIKDIQQHFSGGIWKIPPNIPVDNDGTFLSMPNPIWRTSGGIMYFDRLKVTELGYTMYANRSRVNYGDDDEVFWDSLLFDTERYAFSPIYNCQPSKQVLAQNICAFIEAADRTLLLEHYKSIGFEDSLRELRKIAAGKAAIFHWDAITKPWNKDCGGRNWYIASPDFDKGDGKVIYPADEQWMLELNEIEAQMGIKVGKNIKEDKESKKVSFEFCITPQNETMSIEAISIDRKQTVTIDNKRFTYNRGINSKILSGKWLIVTFAPSEIPSAESSAKSDFKIKMPEMVMGVQVGTTIDINNLAREIQNTEPFERVTIVDGINRTAAQVVDINGQRFLRLGVPGTNLACGAFALGLGLDDLLVQAVRPQQNLGIGALDPFWQLVADRDGLDIDIYIQPTQNRYGIILPLTHPIREVRARVIDGRQITRRRVLLDTAGLGHYNVLIDPNDPNVINRIRLYTAMEGGFLGNYYQPSLREDIEAYLATIHQTNQPTAANSKIIRDDFARCVGNMYAASNSDGLRSCLEKLNHDAKDSVYTCYDDTEIEAIKYELQCFIEDIQKKAKPEAPKS